jgi:hypothetical protein
MSHKLVSNKAVMYDAQTQAESYLTLVPKATIFVDSEQMSPIGDSHFVNVKSAFFANYSSSQEEGMRLGGFDYNLTEQEWDTFFNSQTFTSTGSYDQVIEASLNYIKENMPVVFGLSQSDWIYQE